VFGLTRRASLLWLLVSGGGSLLLIGALVTAPWSISIVASAVLLTVADAIADSFRVALPTSRAGNRVENSVGAAIAIAAVLLLPLQWAVLTVSVGIVLGRRTAWYKSAFNGGQAAISATLGGLLWHLGNQAATLTDLHAAPFVIAASLVYATANILFVSGIVALASGLPMRVGLTRGYRHTWPATVGVVFVGVLIAVLWSISAWTVALAAIPLTALYYTLRNTVSLETNTVDALFQLADILDARDAYTHGHSLRVGQYAEKLALSLGIPGDDAHLIFLAGRLHDIGKCAIRNEVLLKPGALNDEEREHMCIHPAVGGSMLESFSLFKECARYVRGHHERWDGNGYPDKLSGEAIPLGARIIAVADAFDAMTTTRPYRKALPVAEAHRRLEEGAGTQWDPKIIKAFLKLLETTPLGQHQPVALPVQTPSAAAAA